ncbi:DUF4263 domain-containing protein [Methylobacterium sp. WL12]|uniref:Shedu immune nuclease family protein n=1 Tax=Methylobacterium sp. WL12 TaxID=2603890 RepID=UPI0011C98C02|nr:Shedu immune nuclease family protein [Methylobacterium sp. WL12]TXM64829.1 DUF4263 domain-containing protein [Methylobacterium sp. WL12]
MGDDGQYFAAKQPDRLYVSKRFGNVNDTRIISEIVQGTHDDHFASLKDEAIIRRTAAKRFEIKATLTEDDRAIKTLTLQQWSVDDGHPYDKTHFSFTGADITRLLDFVERIKTVHLDGPEKRVIRHRDLMQVSLTPEQARRLVSARKDLVIDVATHEVTQQDIIALAYRKQELSLFERLLGDQAFFAEEKARTGKRDEALWQTFFERNPWIFGHGLAYAFMTGLDDRKLEQVVAGFDVAGPGKRADGLLKTHAHLSSLAFVEVKRHDTPLVRPSPYRPGVWSASEELAGGVAQSHETVRSAGEKLGERLRPVDSLGDPTGEDLFNVQPRAFLVVGQLSEFRTNAGPNIQKFRCFEAFRRNLHQPEILTFDELLHRARFIVDAQSASAAASGMA